MNLAQRINDLMFHVMCGSVAAGLLGLSGYFLWTALTWRVR